MEIKINNKPAYANNYEFVVVREFNGEWWFCGAYANGFEAEQEAIAIHGMIIHNALIQGMKEN